MNQKEFLTQKLTHLYNYIGVSRNGSGEGEQVGVFYDKQRFLLVDYGFRWISESKTPGSVDFGAKFPRYYTYLILEDTFVSEKFINSLQKSN